MNRLFLIPALLGLLLCTGCTKEPEYVPPADAIPDIPPSTRSEGGPAGTAGSGGAGSKLSAPPK